MKRNLTGVNVRSDKVGDTKSKVISVTLEFGEYIIDIEGVLDYADYERKFSKSVDFGALEDFLIYQIKKTCANAGFHTRD